MLANAPGRPAITQGYFGVSPTKRGKVLSHGSAGAWDEAMAEGGQVFWDPAQRRWGMVYVGYSGALSGGFPPAGSLGKIGLAWSDDLVTWTKDAANPIFAGTGNVGVDWDGGTISAPYMYVEGGTYYLFYIGVATTGWEASGGGTFKLGVATASTATGPYTRSGSNPLISPTGAGAAWRSNHIFHPSIVKRGATYYLFFNASRLSDSKEQIGYATASALTGPWTVDDTNSPLVTGTGGTNWDADYTADPAVHRLGNDLWLMAYAGNKTGSVARDGCLTTPDSAFPLGWQRHGANPQLIPTDTYDTNLCAKPCLVFNKATLYHFYTATSADGTDIGVGLATNSL